MLTTAELTFLKSQGLSADDVYDGTYQSRATSIAGAEASGCTLIVRSTCGKGGHRLRTRSGHCAQCNPANLAYQSRHHSIGYVYIAGSRSTRLLKIGTATDIEQRKRNLQNQEYGGIRDWEILFHAKVEHGGKIEGDALRLLRKFKIVRTYEKDGFSQQAEDLLETSFRNAIKAISDAIGESRRENLWMCRHWADYD
jgi:hypothetical protein